MLDFFQFPSRFASTTVVQTPERSSALHLMLAYLASRLESRDISESHKQQQCTPRTGVLERSIRRAEALESAVGRG